MPTVSVVTTTFNEADNIAACLESVAWADERIVVDGTSPDATAEIARRYTDRVFLQPNHDQWNINKNYGFDRACGDWVLSLDADERITDPLAAEIRRTIEAAPADVHGYAIWRRSFFFGHEIRTCGMYHRIFRLFRRGTARFAAQHPHESLELTAGGRMETLAEPMLHYTYDSVADFVSKMNVYTDREAEAIIAGGSRAPARHGRRRGARILETLCPAGGLPRRRPRPHGERAVCHVRIPCPG